MTPFLPRTVLPATLLLAALGSSASAAAMQDDPNQLTPWRIATMQNVSTAEISPNGRHVAYVLAVPRKPRDEEDGGSKLQLHVLDFDSGESRAFVTADSGVSQVHWAPDSTHIGFLAKRDGDDHRALYMISVEGGEARRAFQFEDRSISTYHFAPDGKRLAVVATGPEDGKRKKDKKAGFKPEVYEEDWRLGELWTGVLFDEEAKPVKVALDGHISGVVWAPDGKHVAVSAAPTPLVDDSYTSKRVWVVNVESGTVATRVENTGKLGTYAWAPDGSGLAVIAAFDQHDGSAARLMWAGVGGEASTPTPMLGERERDENQVAWTPEGKLIVRGSQGGWSTLDAYTVSGGKANEREALIPLEGPVWSSMSVSKDGKRFALVGSSPEHGNEVYTLELGGAGLVRRTDSNPWLSEVSLAKQEVIQFPARDGLVVEGILIHPLEASGPAPLIVAVHGGPEAHVSNGWLTRYSYPGQIAAQRGYAIFYPNYRGSTGRGLAYLKASQGDPAGKEFDDVVDGVDHLIRLGVADKDRVGVTGGSYGGYATAWFSTFYSDRFAAGVMAVGISNKISKVGTTDIANEEYLVHAMKRPWDNWQFFLERSPIYYADRGKTPLLILHGKEDTRVDPGQSREMYRHLKLRGQAPVRLVNYPGEGHGNRKAGARFDYNLRMMRWFDHYLKGEGGEAPDWPLDYDEYLPSKKDDKEGDTPQSS